MRIKALLTSILLASTTIAGVASAAPYVRDHRAPVAVRHPVQTRPTYTSNVNYGFQVSANMAVQPYRYGQDPYVEGIARGEWSLVGNNLRFTSNQNDGRIIDLNSRPLSAIELQSEQGCSTIAKIVVSYADGTVLAMTPGRDLDARSAPNLRIDLGARGRVGVKRVLVYGTGGGMFRVLAA